MKKCKTSPIFKIKLIVFSIIISCFIVFIIEIILRLSGYEQIKPTIYNSFFPQTFFTIFQNNDKTLVRIDPKYSSVFNKNEFSIIPEKDTFRVIAMGGSSTYGWGNPSPPENSFVAVFAKLYKEKFPDKKTEYIKNFIKRESKTKFFI